MEIKRRKFQGVLNILSFNRHFYVLGIITLALIITSFSLFNWPVLFLWLIIFAFLYGLIMPLIVSAYVYDFSGYYDFNWLQKFNIEDAAPLINILQYDGYLVKDEENKKYRFNSPLLQAWWLKNIVI